MQAEFEKFCALLLLLPDINHEDYYHQSQSARFAFVTVIAYTDVLHR